MSEDFTTGKLIIGSSFDGKTIEDDNGDSVFSKVSTMPEVRNRDEVNIQSIDDVVKDDKGPDMELTPEGSVFSCSVEAANETTRSLSCTGNPEEKDLPVGNSGL